MKIEHWIRGPLRHIYSKFNLRKLLKSGKSWKSFCVFSLWILETEFDSIYDFNFSVNNSVDFSFFESEVWVFEVQIRLEIMLYCVMWEGYYEEGKVCKRSILLQTFHFYNFFRQTMWTRSFSYVRRRNFETICDLKSENFLRWFGVFLFFLLVVHWFSIRKDIILHFSKKNGG